MTTKLGLNNKIKQLAKGFDYISLSRNGNMNTAMWTARATMFSMRLHGVKDHEGTGTTPLKAIDDFERNFKKNYPTK